MHEAKRCFCRAANAIFGKIGRLASEEATLHRLKTKCIPVLLYGLEALQLNKSQISSIDFVINRFFMKIKCLTQIILILSSAVFDCSSTALRPFDNRMPTCVGCCTAT